MRFPGISREAKVTEARGIEAIKTRLADEGAEVQRLERRLHGARQRRVALERKLRAAGLTLREVATLAGVSNPAIAQREAAERAQAPPAPAPDPDAPRQLAPHEGVVR